MSLPAWHEEPISKKHDRGAFDCGEPALNEFLQRHARQSHDLGGAKTFLAINDAGNKTILGFYSLSPASVEYARTPEIVRRDLALVPCDRQPDAPGGKPARHNGPVRAVQFPASARIRPMPGLGYRNQEWSYGRHR